VGVSKQILVMSYCLAMVSWTKPSLIAWDISLSRLGLQQKLAKGRSEYVL